MIRLTILGLCIVLTACAEVPDNAIVRYYLTNAKIGLSAKETIACDASKGSKTTTALDAKTTVLYYADTDSSPRLLKINDFSTELNDVDITVDLTTDDRLQGINATETGKAEATATGAASFGTAIGKVAGAFQHDIYGHEGGGPTCPPELTGGITQLVVDYESTLQFPRFNIEKYNPHYSPNFGQPTNKVSSATWSMPIDQFSKSIKYSSELKKALRPISAKFILTVPPKPMFGPDVNPNLCNDEDTGPHPYVCLRNTADLAVEVVADTQFPESERLLVPEIHYRVPLSTTTSVPIPAPTAFGKAGVKLSLDDAGGIKEIGFSKTSSLLEVFGATAAVATIAATR